MLQETTARDQATPAASCPRCGADTAPGQLVCLECGTRLGIVYGGRPRWRLALALSVAAVLACGLALGFVVNQVATDDEVKEVAKAPAQGAAPPPGAQPAPAPTPPAETTPPPASEPPPAPEDEPSEPPPAAKGDAEPKSWPAGKSAWTVVLLSAEERSAADAKARDAAKAGLPAGLLRSDDHPGLRPGFWVVFAGEFEERAEAEREAESYAKRGFKDGYPRFVRSQ